MELFVMSPRGGTRGNLHNMGGLNLADDRLRQQGNCCARSLLTNTSPQQTKRATSYNVQALYDGVNTMTRAYAAEFGV